MNEFLKRLFGQIAGLWGKWSLIQKIILLAVVVIAIGGIAVLVAVSSSPSMAPVIDAPIRDEAARDRIITRINQEGVKTSVSSSGTIMVGDENTARRMRSILIREDMIPQGTDPWDIFDRDRWTITDFERKVNVRRSIIRMVTEHIKALDDVDDASVIINIPEKTLFLSDQEPVSASVIITPKPGSDITQNRKKIEGIQKILKFAVEGLADDNIAITDLNGLVLNDFQGLTEWDRLSRIERETQIVRDLESQYRKDILKSLQKIFTADRVRDINIKIDMDMSKKEVDTEEYYPVTLKERTPGLPYDDSQFTESVTISQSTSNTSWKGTGFNPEGPPGVEGQTAPAFRDMSNLYGEVTQTTNTHNEAVNNRKIQEEKSPAIDRVTVSVNIDGTWKWKYDDAKKPVIQPDGSIEREYTPVPAEDLAAAQALIRDAIGFSPGRGDSVTVQNIRFDRTREFSDEDAAFFQQQQMRQTLFFILIGIAILLVGFVMFRLVSREMERRRRHREEELSRQQQAMRESALLEAENEGLEVSMSVEEKRRLDLQENAINMAKEHPGDVAQLIRTWLMEE
ncbi:MAG: flagellar M-ring protein FliF [Spirochaetaceae bacterium]|jgi:flagellar M-ring protein FliF|nr:flagellar M-ring protein FliF [Spirochaetaceae bacterium]